MVYDSKGLTKRGEILDQALALVERENEKHCVQVIEIDRATLFGSLWRSNTEKRLLVAL
jgi:hypothetical protein